MLVLDTHSLIWWVNGSRELSDTARHAIEAEQPGAGVLVSSITAWEIALLFNGGRLVLPMDFRLWLEKAGAISGVEFIPVDNAIAIDSVTLPGVFHKDPADRIIVATARKFAAPIITADDKIRNYQHVRTIW